MCLLKSTQDVKVEVYFVTDTTSNRLGYFKYALQINSWMSPFSTNNSVMFQIKN